MIKKFKECPECGSDELDNKWSSGRKLQQCCQDCEWEGEPRPPERKKIPTSKKVDVDQFGGFNFEGYDKYGHIICFSRTYRNRKEAIKEINRELEAGKREGNDAGPYTIVLYPGHVIVEGEVFK